MDRLRFQVVNFWKSARYVPLAGMKQFDSQRCPAQPTIAWSQWPWHTVALPWASARLFSFVLSLFHFSWWYGTNWCCLFYHELYMSHMSLSEGAVLNGSRMRTCWSNKSYLTLNGCKIVMTYLLPSKSNPQISIIIWSKELPQLGGQVHLKAMY